MKGVRYQCRNCNSTLNALWLKVKRLDDDRWIRAPYYYCVGCGTLHSITDVADEFDITKIFEVLKRYRRDNEVE